MPILSRDSRRNHLSWMLVLVIPAVLIACAAPSAELQDKNWFEPSDLINTSDRVIVAQFLDSREANIQNIDTASGAVSEATDVLFRQFEVIETLKGTIDPGDTLWIAFAPGRPGELVDGKGSVRSFDPTKTYVLFLKGRLRPLEYPTEFGPVLWTGNGEPSIAELIGDRLDFRAERPYLELLEREGRTLPEMTSAAPFTLSLTTARETAR